MREELKGKRSLMEFVCLVKMGINKGRTLLVTSSTDSQILPCPKLRTFPKWDFGVFPLPSFLPSRRVSPNAELFSTSTSAIGIGIRRTFW